MRTSRTPIAAALASSLLLVGCAGTHQLGESTTDAGAPPAAETPKATESSELARLRRAERHEMGATSERKAYEVRQALDAAWDEGQARWLDGDTDGAFDSFDSGIDAVLRAKLDLDAVSYTHLTLPTICSV